MSSAKIIEQMNKGSENGCTIGQDPESRAGWHKGAGVFRARGTTAKCISSEQEETGGGVWEQPRLAGGGLLVRCSKFRSWKLEEGVEIKSG